MLPLSISEYREATILLSEKINANSRVVGVKVFADHIWAECPVRRISVASVSGALFAFSK